jgi:hypothetical protein
MSNSTVSLGALTIALTFLLAVIGCIRFASQRKDRSKEQGLRSLGTQALLLAFVAFLFACGTMTNALYNAIRLHLVFQLPVWQVAGQFAEGMVIVQLQILMAVILATTAFFLFMKVPRIDDAATRQ